MSSFTPGPWVVVENAPGATEPAVMTGDGYFFIATIHGMGDGGKDTLTNARLIAESPTLHDLLLTTIWVKKSDGQQYCHRCLAGRAEGHTADCELDAVFRRIGSETGTG